MKLIKGIFWGYLLLPILGQANSIFKNYEMEAKRLVAKMTLEEKIGEMILPTFDFIAAEQGKQTSKNCQNAWLKEKDLLKLGNICGFKAISHYHLGAMLVAGGPLAFSGTDQSEKNWKKVTDLGKAFYTGPEKTFLLLGTDAIHGNQHITGSITFPHNIGLGATHDPVLVEKVAAWTRYDILRSGFNWSFMPTVAVAQDYRWGRSYESFSSNPDIVKALSFAYVSGLQDVSHNQLRGVLATAKHFVGDGATQNGVDEGNVPINDLNNFWKIHGAGYEGAVAANVGSIMASYNSINNIPMHFGGEKNILQQFKKNQFNGFIVSDYAGISRAAYKYNQLHTPKLNYAQAVAKSINAGVDMLMIANIAFIDPFQKNPQTYYQNIKQVRDVLLEDVKKGLISNARINEAVERILATKLSMSPQNMKPSGDEATLATQAAEESLVLLRNENHLLPLSKNNIKNIILLGSYDDIGSQNGGWTINWQGQKGNDYWPPKSIDKKNAAAFSVKDGLQQILNSNTHYFENVSKINLTKFQKENTIAILVLAEIPYAEYMGDVDNNNPWYNRGAHAKENNYMPVIQSTFLGLKLNPKEIEILKQLKMKNIPVVTILFSGRPIIITEGGDAAPLQNSDAFIAAFLPGNTAGLAIAKTLFGEYTLKSHKNRINNKDYYSNTLPFSWPKNMTEVRTHSYSLFPEGYGLSNF